MCDKICTKPTGYMHVGGLYAALVSWRMAAQSDGVFYLRIEDTERSVRLKTESDKLFLLYISMGLSLTRDILNRKEVFMVRIFRVTENRFIVPM